MTVPSFVGILKITNKTFTKFVNDYRLVHASKLLAEKPISISESLMKVDLTTLVILINRLKRVHRKSHTMQS
jgi:AraC-like DNA-binding protein